MGILPTQTIRKLCLGTSKVVLVGGEPELHEQPPMISPFTERAVSNGNAYGLSSASYDIRIAETVWVWPLWGRLASSIEHFNMPDDVLGTVRDKSTWVRNFITAQNTVIKPGWRGRLTLELTRHLPWPIRIKAGSPIVQIIFERLEAADEDPYDGKYQDQPPGPQPARYET